jgi:hypothetical protein
LEDERRFPTVDATRLNRVAFGRVAERAFVPLSTLGNERRRVLAETVRRLRFLRVRERNDDERWGGLNYLSRFERFLG